MMLYYIKLVVFGFLLGVFIRMAVRESFGKW